MPPVTSFLPARSHLADQTRSLYPKPRRSSRACRIRRHSSPGGRRKLAALPLPKAPRAGRSLRAYRHGLLVRVRLDVVGMELHLVRISEAAGWHVAGNAPTRAIHGAQLLAFR